MINAADGADEHHYYIDRGQESNINVGDALNVYGEIEQQRRMFVGTLTITDAQQGSALGTFKATNKALNRRIEVVVSWESPDEIEGGEEEAPRLSSPCHRVNPRLAKVLVDPLKR